MPGHMDKGTKNYRNMMKKMEGMNSMSPDNIESIIKGDPNLEKMKMQPLSEEMLMRQINAGTTSDAEMKSMANSMLDSEKESMMKMLQGMDFAPSDIKFLQLSQTICLPPLRG